MSGPAPVSPRTPTTSTVDSTDAAGASGPSPSARARHPIDRAKNTIARHEERRAPFEPPHVPLKLDDLPVLSAAELQAGSTRGYLLEVLGRSANDTLDGFVSGTRNLSKRDFHELMTLLRDSGRFGETMKRLESDPRLRADFLTAAVQCGYLEATPARAQAKPGVIAPPEQPALVKNDPLLPQELRSLIHAENKQLAAAYLSAFDRYTDAWCKAVAEATTPGAIRTLGDFSTPPTLYEPGVTGSDHKRNGWSQGLTGTGRGIERASRALSDKISDLRGEARAGSYSLDLQGGLKVKAGAGFFKQTLDAKGTATELGAKADLGPVALTGSADSRGNTTKGVTIGSFTAERTVDGKGRAKDTFTVKVNENLSTYASVGEATFGGGLKATTKVGDSVELSVKVGFKAHGIPREYYQDIGSAPSGFFGPMPEFEQQVSWQSMPPERRDWYARQGFTPQNWSVR